MEDYRKEREVLIEHIQHLREQYMEKKNRRYEQLQKVATSVCYCIRMYNSFILSKIDDSLLEIDKEICIARAELANLTYGFMKHEFEHVEEVVCKKCHSIFHK